MFQYKKIWICGAKGRVGSALSYLLDPYQIEILQSDIDDVDVTNLSDVLLFGERNHPQYIINCTGLNDVEACEKNPEEAFRINTIGTRNLAVVANELDAVFIQLSTDDVFSGLAEKPYTEFDTPNPLSVYGKTKLAAENFVRELTHQHFIIRSNWLYGKSKLKKFIYEAKKKGNVHVPYAFYGSPTSSIALTDFILELLDSHAYGTYHASCEGVVTYREFVETVLNYANIHVPVIEDNPENTAAKGRPAYGVLDNFMLRTSRLYQMPHWKDALDEFVKGRIKP